MKVQHPTQFLQTSSLAAKIKDTSHAELLCNMKPQRPAMLAMAAIVFGSVGPVEHRNEL